MKINPHNLREYFYVCQQVLESTSVVHTAYDTLMFIWGFRNCGCWCCTGSYDDPST